MNTRVVVLAVSSTGAIEAYVDGDSWGSFSDWSALLEWNDVCLHLTDTFILRVVQGIF